MVGLRTASILPGLLLLQLLTPSSLGHDDSGSRYPGSNDDAVAGTYVGPAGVYVPAVPPATTGPMAPGQSVCDLEYIPALAASSEPRVDGGAMPGGMVPDGTWDDGGYGGACHLAYAEEGCPDDVARAEDVVLSGAVWIATACDWLTASGGVSSCGADGTPDAFAFGSGNPGVAYPSAGAASSGCGPGWSWTTTFVLASTSGVPSRGVIWAD